MHARRWRRRRLSIRCVDTLETIDDKVTSSGLLTVDSMARWQAQALFKSGLVTLDRLASADPRLVAKVSRSCACIGSPCLRSCVHGASIGAAGQGAFRAGCLGAAARRLRPQAAAALHAGQQSAARSTLHHTRARQCVLRYGSIVLDLDRLRLFGFRGRRSCARTARY
jgi:hypothetical protein